MAKKEKKPTWQFLWWKAEEYPSDNPGERVYTAPTIRQACTKMLRWIEGRNFEVVIDYEARANHVPYRANRHSEKYPDLSELDHEIRAFIA